MNATPPAESSAHPVIQFCQTKDIVAAATSCGRSCCPGEGTSCRCLDRTKEIYGLFGIEVLNITLLEDGEVLGLCTSGMLVQWNRDEHRCYASDTLDEFGAENLRDEELARLRLPIAPRSSADAQ